jgi:hypothetical protein
MFYILLIGTLFILSTSKQYSYINSSDASGVTAGNSK